ncbi:glycosyltransferase family 39 protein [Desulfoluna spongiiphila]|uniref:4-amino-4-deoxy-L-arabinose transferase n=1 Tax=Desulfoluna spongiiphila TaxID=419481 RepID=A0A1G5GVU2_9BACT|nr:glycosyltransferase family 39 protein [Desulfoluna spongiiphila]SCY55666.1 4-amino-4-deoxy-L-arabinose transferase [Desulfoluna spongiiphila]
MVRIHNPRVALFLTLLLVLAFTLPAAGLMGVAPLVTDDPVTAAAALDMAGAPELTLDMARGYLTELPPLYPMAAAAVSHGAAPFFQGTAALRLTSALFSLGTLILFFFFALRYGGNLFALLAVALLATMPGFAFGATWIGQDPALGFFLMASVAAVAKTFFDDSPTWILMVGVAAAGAFLTSAWDGVIPIACLWATGIVWFVGTQKPDRSTHVSHLFFHLAALLVILVLAGGGIAIQFVGTTVPPLTQGFWMPAGRLSPSPDLLELAVRLLVHTLPWTPLFFLYAGLTTAQTLRSGTFPATPVFLAVWFFSTLLLPLSGDTGLTPVLPPLSLMAAFALNQGMPVWVKRYATAWSWAVILTLFVLALSPGLRPLALRFDHGVIAGLLDGGITSPLAAAGFILAALTCMVKTIPLTRTGRLLTVTAILWITLANGPFSAVAGHRAVEIKPLITAIKAHPHKGTAAFGVDRRLRASLCFYGQLHLLTTDNLERCYDILKGGDPDFDTLLMQSDAMDHLPEALSMVPVTIVKKLPLRQGGSLLFVQGQ